MTQDQRETVFPDTVSPEIGAGEGMSWSWHLDLDALLAALSEPAPWNSTRPSPVRPRVPAGSPRTDQSPDHRAADPHSDTHWQEPPDNTGPADARPGNAPSAYPRPADPRPDDSEPDGARPGCSPSADARSADPPPDDTQRDGARPGEAGPGGARPGRGAGSGDDVASGGDCVPGEARQCDAEPSCGGLSSAAARSAGPVDPVEAEFAEYIEAVDAGRTSVMPLSVAAGRIAETLPTSPDLAAWLAFNPAEGLEDGALAGAAASYRRLAAWAQSGELAVVAQMASRSAASDQNIGTGDDGRPGKVPADAYGQVSLALTMSQAGAEWWTNLAVDLQWRLAATGLALRDGVIDLARAKAIAEATAPLDEDKARAVEAKVLPRAGEQTTGQLRASLRRAVITADPEGAERRREEAERRAKVTLYPDAEGTATLTGQRLPGIRAAAAYARITALARALKAAGTDGGIDLLRSKVLLGLLLGTLPYIPPPPDGPPDTDSPPPPGSSPDANSPSDSGPRGGQPTGPDDEGSPHLDDWPWNNDPDATRPAADARDPDGTGPGADPGKPDAIRPGADPGGPAGGSPELGPMPWPDATPLLPPAPAALKNLQPGGSGFLDLRLPWLTLAESGPEPGYLTRLGPITPAQASYLALLAAADPAVEWRAVITNPAGRVIAVTWIRSGRSPAGPARASPRTSSSLLHRVTVIISTDEISAAARSDPAPDDMISAVLAAIITAARKAAVQAAERGVADANADGGCAHTQASLAYQVPARLREFVNLRDLTCRFPTCRQPAWRCDADHTKPYDQDGPTCLCNLGPLCRYHHQLKQHPGWHLDQPAPGTFTWTTPTGRTYRIEPDAQAA